jgi:hypothetical protein
MAITIQAVPDNYSSVHGNLIYTVAETAHTADPSTYPNYKFIADVYIGGNLIGRIKKVPDPTTHIGIFNIGQIIRNYLECVFNPTASVLKAQELVENQFFLSVQVKFGEEYGTTSYYGLVSDSSRRFFNNYNTRLAGVSTSLSPLTNKVASSRPDIGEVFLDSKFAFMPYFPIVTSAVSFVVTPQGGGSVLSTTFTPAQAYNMQILNVSPQALNAVSPGTINASTTKYTVQIGSQTYTFNLICEPINNKYALHFLNKYGGFETKIFNKVSRKTLNFERKDFGKLPFIVDSSGVVSYKNSNGVYNESRSVYSVQHQEKLTLNSDILTDAEYEWLFELVASPMVYIEDGNYFFPCIMTENNYEPKKYINDSLTNLTINIEYGQQLNSQFR